MLNRSNQCLYITIGGAQIAGLKQRIAEACGLPAGKQKLQLALPMGNEGGPFVKDARTLASYNAGTGTMFLLAIKERGGRKKWVSICFVQFLEAREVIHKAVVHTLHMPVLIHLF